MKFTIFLATSAMLALSACGGEDRSQTSEQTNVATENMALDNMSMTNDSANMMGGAETAANGQEYAAMASASDMFEIESSRLATEKSQNAGVKELAQMLITDHEKSTADLKKAAGEAKPAINVSPQMNAEQQANIQALRSANGAQFDQTWLQQQVMAHQKALALVQGYSGTGEVESLKQHATKVAGPIQKHLEQAQRLSQQGQ